jgi:MscS family membrane protein
MNNFFTRLAFLALILTLCQPLSAQGALGALLQTPTPANASTKATADPLGRDTPYGTVFGFLQQAEKNNYSVAAQYLQMSLSRRQTEGAAVAEDLKEVMDRGYSGTLGSKLPDGEQQESEGVPAGRQRLGMISAGAGDAEANLELVRVSDPSGAKIWLISSDTLAKLPELYDQVSARKVETRLPQWMVKYQPAGMPLWQWLALVLLIPVAAGVGWLVLVVLQIPLRWWTQKHGHVELAARSVSRPAWLLVGILIHWILARYLRMPLLQRHYYFQFVKVAVIIGAFWILWSIIRWFLRGVRNRALAHGHSGTGSLMLLGERIVKAVIVVMAIFLILGVLGLDMSKALAGVGIGALAFAFGAQQSIANLFGGVFVLGDEVIHVGDVCKFGDRTGTVEDIGLRSTRVRTEERTLLAIPNGTVATINVENLSRRDKILFKTVLGFHLDTSSDHLRDVLSEIHRVIGSNPKVENSTVRVRLVELGSAAINVEVVCYVMTTEFDKFAEVREELLLQIMKFVEDSPANFASPSQTLYLSRDPKATKEQTDDAVNAIRDQKQDRKNAGDGKSAGNDG